MEIEPVGGSYDYSARYTPGAAAFTCPARLDAAVLKALEEAALAAHQLLGLRDVSRTDAIVDAAGRVQILEVNVSPGLTETSLLPIAARTVGMELGELYAGLVERAVSRETYRGPPVSRETSSRLCTDPNSLTGCAPTLLICMSARSQASAPESRGSRADPERLSGYARLTNPALPPPRVRERTRNRYEIHPADRTASTTGIWVDPCCRRRGRHRAGGVARSS